MSYIVIAQFRVKPSCVKDFLVLAQDDAKHSVEDEAGCLQFDVSISQVEMSTVLFYEVYQSRAAFEAHLKTPHLERFREGFSPLIEEELPVHFLDRSYSVKS